MWGWKRGVKKVRVIFLTDRHRWLAWLGLAESGRPELGICEPHYMRRNLGNLWKKSREKLLRMRRFLFQIGIWKRKLSINLRVWGYGSCWGSRRISLSRCLKKRPLSLKSVHYASMVTRMAIFALRRLS